MEESNTLTPQRSKALHRNSTRLEVKKSCLLLEDYTSIGIFVAFEPRQEGHAEQVFCERLVGKHQGGHVIGSNTAELDTVDRGTRRLDLSIGRYRSRRVVARPRANPDPRGVRFAQHDERGAGVDNEVDASAVDPGLNLEVAKTIRFKHQAAP